MPILVIREKVTPEQLREMLQEHAQDQYVKLAVDVQQEILAGGGEWHADCETVLLENESSTDVWGAGWLWQSQEVTFDSLINIRPGRGNLTLELQDPALRRTVERIVKNFFAGVQP
jgi:Protein of unknown function (DUF5674)